MFWKKKNNTNAGRQVPDLQNGSGDPVNIKVVIKSDLGNVRTNNEDAASFFRMTDGKLLREKGYLLIVADGMGGHLAGEVASKMAVDIISEEYFRPANDSDREKALASAFNLANKKIFELAAANEQYRGMGTTCTAIVVIASTIYYAHAGDSRAYLYKDNKLTRITEDHTYVQELVNNGDISNEQAETHPQRNILTNAMGTKPVLRVDTGKCLTSFEQNNRLLLCSDGLYDYLSDQEIAAVMSAGSLQEAADYFISESKRRGGKDNITVVLAEIYEEKKEPDLRSTMEYDLPKMTRDADIPEGLNDNNYDR
ncbi:protein-serine/threonine phosphatase PrpC [soil metagenome]